MFVRASLFVLLIPSLAAASAMDEVNHWRKANGLPELKEVEWMTEFAQNKAEWRAARLAKNGSHLGLAHLLPGGERQIRRCWRSHRGRRRALHGAHHQRHSRQRPQGPTNRRPRSRFADY